MKTGKCFAPGHRSLGLCILNNSKGYDLKDTILIDFDGVIPKCLNIWNLSSSEQYARGLNLFYAACLFLVSAGLIVHNPVWDLNTVNR